MLRRSGAVGLLLVALAPSAPLAADPRPTLAVTFLDETQHEGSVRLQAGKVNRFLKTLDGLFPELDVKVEMAPTSGADYRLRLQSMTSTDTYLKIEASFERGGEVILKETGVFTEGCSATDESRDKCTFSSLEQRAERAVADLLNKTVLHWEEGIYRLVDVRRCESLPPIGVALQVSASSVVDDYDEPSDRFDYSAGVLVTVFENPYPVPRNLMLRRKDKLPSGFAFSRLRDPGQHLEELCRLEEHWVLLHRYQRRELLEHSERSEGTESETPLPVAINSALPTRSEE